jgi:hypothetical protein
VVVLTETKRSSKMQLPKALHKSYCIYESRRQEAAAGVAVLVQRHWCAVDAAHPVPVPTECRGYLADVRLQPRGGPAMHVLGVYMPGDAERRAAREAAYAHLGDVLAQAGSCDTVRLTGDGNACLHAADRQGQLTACDREHMRWVAQQPRLGSAYGAGQREPTFSVGGMGASPSMIDDTLVLPPVAESHAAHLVIGCGIQPHSWSTDHALLHCDVDLAAAGVHIPQPRPAARGPPLRRMVLPVAEEERQRFQLRLLEENAGAIARLTERGLGLGREVEEYAAALEALDAREVHKLGTLEGRVALGVIEEFAAGVMAILENGAHRIAPEVCTMQETNPSGTHYRPRATGARRRRLVAITKSIRLAAGLVHQMRRDAGPALGERELANQVLKQNLDSLRAEMGGAAAGSAGPAAEADTLQALQRAERCATAQKRAIDAEHQRLGLQEAQQRQQRLLQDQPILAHKQIFGKQQLRQRLEVVTDPATGRPTTCPEVVIGATDKHFSDKAAPPRGVKTGGYLPADAPRNYPWGRLGALDGYMLETGATNLATRPWLLHRVRDEQLFFLCCQRLSNGKAPRPDKVTNEVLKMRY